MKFLVVAVVWTQASPISPLMRRRIAWKLDFRFLASL